jgi:Tfp pilus assembly protein PilF
MSPSYRMPIVGLPRLIAVLLSAAAPAALAQHEGHEHLGTVHFATSCNEKAQEQFDLAMKYQHSFWYRESKKAFEAALKADPHCGIAYWGIAQSLLANPFNPTPPKNLAEGLAATRMGQQIGARTQRERDLISAIAVFYADYGTVDQRTRAQSYLKSMEQVAGRYPNDDEVQIYYALALNVAASPADKSYANQLKAAAILESISKRQPNHPGVAHYLIHTYDYPPLAQKGLEAARRYAVIAEAAPHAQHMPSHIFTRVGEWEASIASNRAAADLARKDKEPDDQLHALDYMVYACLQLGRDREAREIIDEMATVTGYNLDRNTAAFALAASPARYVVERNDWAGAAKLTLRRSRFGYADAMTHFARALGNVRTGHPSAAKADLTRLTEIRDQLREAKDAYWSEQVDIQRQIVAAWMLSAEHRHDEALQAMSAAADAEDKTEKATVSPGPLVPARELYAVMLLEQGKGAKALDAFEASMAREPNRFNGLAGAARAAERAGDNAKAKTYYTRLVALASRNGGSRQELEIARQFLAKNSNAPR